MKRNKNNRCLSTSRTALSSSDISRPFALSMPNVTRIRFFFVPVSLILEKKSPFPANKLHVKYTWGGGPKNSRNCYKKILLKLFLQVWNFSPLGITPPATGYSNPRTALSSLSIVRNVWKQKYKNGVLRATSVFEISPEFMICSILQQCSTHTKLYERSNQRRC
jgi:hypothetical protein